ncbi:MAB_1171c family putative transporter [Streptomyces sp. NBC_01565]|uniref:MAB_1171c family putative transporter n=1 Tax=unclassified Streptomyces TaxID=2593676 RepID=UPI002254D4EC|nr:MAB_1171c family putative transporter [Streptomyces sp. NBC_01565]MCX4539541.1 hypothetical protein [Streptomyces sp. NBC_01565]
MNDPHGLAFYIPGTFLAVILCMRLPALRRHPQDRLLRSVCLLLATAIGVFFSCAVPTVAAVNRLTGVPNAAAPIVYSLLTAFSGATILLIIHWSRGPDEADRAARWARRCKAATMVVIIAVNVLFLLGDAPVERLTDLDTYYASTPFIREMILLYLLAHTATGIIGSALCARWARQVHGGLKAGLALITLGYLLNLSYDVLKFSAIGARWAHRDWDQLSTRYAAALASLSAVVAGLGFVLPLLSQRITAYWDLWRRFHQLRPLWRELRAATQRSIALTSGPCTPIEIRVTQLESDIHDGILAVSPHLDARQRERALEEARRSSRSADDVVAIADAAALAHAVVVWARHAPPAEDGTAGAGDAAPFHQNHRSVLTLPDHPAGLVRMSLALSSEVVKAFRDAAALEHSAR